MRRSIVYAALLAALSASPSQAQFVLEFVDRLDFDRPEAWAMKYFSAVNQLTGLGVPEERRPGSVELAFEGSWLPSLSEAERTVGFLGTKREDLNRTSVFGRPRVTVGLPAKLSLEASYLPPVELFGVESHLIAVALARPLNQGRRWRLGGRVSAQYGTLTGDFTCPEAEVAAGDNLTLNPFRCEQVSNDRMTINAAGLEIGAARRPRSGGSVEPYLTFGATLTDLEFQVRAIYAGLDDRTRLVADGWIYYTAAGVNVDLGRRLSAVGEIFYSPLDVVGRAGRGAESGDLLHARAAVRYALR